MTGYWSNASFWVGAIALFIALGLAMAVAGVYVQPNALPLTNLQVHIAISLGLFWALYFAAPGFKHAVRNADLHALTAFQCFRVLGGAVLFLWGYGLIPGGFALPMSVLDMSVGVMAFFGLRKLWTGAPSTKSFLRTLHVWSIADFLVTILLALFCWRALAIDPAMNPAGYAQLVRPPLVALPAIAIPIFSWASFAALVRIKHLEPAAS